MAFHIEDLPEATAELQQLLAHHGYDDACIYGHALEGNYHFIINQSFLQRSRSRTLRGAHANEVKMLVVDKIRRFAQKQNTARDATWLPSCNTEWGETAFELMRAVKQLFDPQRIA